MELPKEPIYCEICKKDSMLFTKAKQQDGSHKISGMFTLSTPRFNYNEYRFHPITAMCNNCGQVKIFFKPDRIIT